MTTTTTEETTDVTEEIDTEETPDETTEDESEPDTFPRDYVQKLRDESAKYRTRAQQADLLAQRLHMALAVADGRLADPTDLPFDPSHLETPEALTKAIDDLTARKPHLLSRKPSGDIGAGATSNGHDVSLAGLLRSRT